MKNIFAACALLLAGHAAIAQGIQFEQGDWASVKAKARKENKLIYVDAYTTWCGPCKMLEANIFPQKAAGDYYNANFVNYRVDAEKGEGITIAEQYNVQGYPTHLFIEPASGKIVYRGSGYSPDVRNFVHEGEIAGLEWKDPMTLDKYATQFGAKKKDKAFLKAYLQKTERLSQENDDILNAYVALLDPKKASDEEVIFLQQNIRSLDNNAVAFIKSRRDVFTRKYPENPNYLNDITGRWIGGTAEKAVRLKNERLLDKMAAALKETSPDDYEEQMFFWRARYYTQTGNKAEAAKIGAQEAAYYMNRTDEQYAKADAAALKDLEQQVRWQLKEMKAPADQMETLVKQNLNKPSLQRSKSIQAAQKLNSVAWAVYENASIPLAVLNQGVPLPNNSKSPTMLQQALGWSKRSMELIGGDNNEDWPAFADTYAHLLYVAGKKEEAVKIEQQAIDKLKAAGSDKVGEYEEEIGKMRSGSL